MKYIRFYPDAWLSGAMFLSLEAEGAWIRILCLLASQPSPGKLECSMAHLCRALRVQPGKAKALLMEIKDAQACQVKFDDESVSIICDRMTREAEEYNAYAAAKAAAGRAGGKASVQARAKAKAKQTLSKNEANVNDCLSKREANAKHSISISKAKDKDLLKADAKQPPSLDEIKAFCASRSIPEQRAIDFYNYYQGQNLWLNKNKTPVRWWHIIQNSPWTDDQKRKGNYNGSVRQPDRNEGTANSGQASQYEGLGQVV